MPKPRPVTPRKRNVTAGERLSQDAELTNSDSRLPLCEHTSEDFLDYFMWCNSLSYIFISGGGSVRKLGPDLNSAIALAKEALLGMEHEPTRDELTQECDSSNADSRRGNTVHDVGVVLSEMIRRGDSFILAWHIEGDLSVHLRYSQDQEHGDVATQIRELLKDELDDFLY